MATRNRITWLLVLALSGAGVACGSDSEDAPPDSGGSFVRRDAGNDEEEDTGTEEIDGGVEDAGDEDTVIASESEAKAKGWVTGCYKKPTKNEEFLNSCASGYREFDESWYPASWKKGQLPTLP